MLPEELRVYHDLLLKWNKAINLVSGGTLEAAWGRHFEDSAQLLEYIPDDAKTLVDLGSGGGFPGMVLAILRPGLDVHLIESDGRKCEFLKTVSRETHRIVNVHNGRAESILTEIEPHIVTARAFAPLVKILDMVAGKAADNRNLKLLLLKGRGAAQEIEEARARYDFEVELFPSRTEEGACILRISGLKSA